MRTPKECPHGILGIAKCHICKSEYNKQYRQRPEIQAHEKQYQKQYHQRPEIKARHNLYQKQYYQRPEVKAYHKQYSQRPEVQARRKQYFQRLEVKARSKEYGSTWIKLLLEHYNTELAKLDSQMKKWVIPPIPLEGKRVQFQNIIDNLETIRKYTKSLPISVRSETTKRMLTELLENEGKLVSWRKPLPTGT
jgi:hypothetical protein